MTKIRPRKQLALTLALGVLLVAGCRQESSTHEEHHDERDQHHDEHEGVHGEEGVVELSPEAVARIGLRTVPVSLRPLAGRQATTGKVGFDETRLAHVGARVSGRLVRVEAGLGDRLDEGAVLAVVDSVELGQARADYLRARARHEVAEKRLERARSLHADRIVSEAEVLEAEAEAREVAADLAASRETLALLGLANDEIDKLSWGDASASLVAVRAPFAGWVIAKEATRGELVAPEKTLFTVADLGEVWLWIDVYERQLRSVRLGDRVEARFDAWPGDTFTGELAYLADELDPASRTIRARVDLPNPQRRLKPGMFARVLLSADGEDGQQVLAVSREAVQRQGDSAVVFVKTGERRFERRPVELGQATDQWVEILSGLTAGEEVVTVGAFLLKSQASADQLGGHHH